MSNEHDSRVELEDPDTAADVDMDQPESSVLGSVIPPSSPPFIPRSSFFYRTGARPIFENESSDSTSSSGHRSGGRARAQTRDSNSNDRTDNGEGSDSGPLQNTGSDPSTESGLEEIGSRPVSLDEPDMGVEDESDREMGDTTETERVKCKSLSLFLLVLEIY